VGLLHGPGGQQDDTADVLLIAGAKEDPSEGLSEEGVEDSVDDRVERRVEIAQPRDEVDYLQ
jgi:hypothetical protein